MTDSKQCRQDRGTKDERALSPRRNSRVRTADRRSSEVHRKFREGGGQGKSANQGLERKSESHGEGLAGISRDEERIAEQRDRWRQLGRQQKEAQGTIQNARKVIKASNTVIKNLEREVAELEVEVQDLTKELEPFEGKVFSSVGVLLTYERGLVETLTQPNRTKNTKLIFFLLDFQ